MHKPTGRKTQWKGERKKTGRIMLLECPIDFSFGNIIYKMAIEEGHNDNEQLMILTY